MDKPKVSVVMPAYNASQFITKSIEAVLNQSMDLFELLVIDDGSKDNTIEIVSQIKDERLKIIKKENGGAASARNAGLLDSKGEYVAYCDSDDLFGRDHLMILSNHLDSHPETGMVYSKAKSIAPDGSEVGQGWGFEFDPKKFEHFCLMVPSISMHRKICIEKSGIWDESRLLRCIHEDWDFFLRIHDYYKIDFIDIYTALWTRRPTGLCQNAFLSENSFLSLEYIIKKRLAHFKSVNTSGILAPLWGYYYYNFVTCRDTVDYGVKNGAFNAQDIYQRLIEPMFEDFSKIDGKNLEIWLVLALIYFIEKKSDKVVAAAQYAAKYLSQKIEVNKDIEGVVTSTIKAIAFELQNSGQKELAGEFINKAKEITVK